MTVPVVTARHDRTSTLTTGKPGRVPEGVKVPQVLAIFWVTKALTTALGESTSDFLVHAMPPVAAVLLGFVAFCIALTVQLRYRRSGD